MRARHWLGAILLLLLFFFACQREPMIKLPAAANGTEIVTSGALWPLRYEGGKVLIHSEVLKRPLLLVKGADDSLHAFDSWCTHNGCEITISESGKFFCSCHSNTFEDDGTPVDTSGEDLLRALVEYRVTTRGDSILIDLAQRTIRDQAGNLLEDPVVKG